MTNLTDAERAATEADATATVRVCGIKFIRNTFGLWRCVYIDGSLGAPSDAELSHQNYLDAIAELDAALRAEQEKVKAYEAGLRWLYGNATLAPNASPPATDAKQDAQYDIAGTKGDREAAEQHVQILRKQLAASEAERERLQRRVATFEALAVRATVTRNSPHAVNLRYLVVCLSALAPTADAKQEPA